MNLTPNSFGSVREFNTCHDDQGKFCDTNTGAEATPKKAPPLAKLLNQMRTLFPDLKVDVRPWTTNTDRQDPGHPRLRIEGKGREGLRIQVFRPEGTGFASYPAFQHETGESGARNINLVDWMVGEGERRGIDMAALKHVQAAQLALDRQNMWRRTARRRQRRITRKRQR